MKNIKKITILSVSLLVLLSALVGINIVKATTTSSGTYGIYPNEYHYECTCDFVPCKGSPCQQITDYASQLWNLNRQLKLDFMDFYAGADKKPGTNGNPDTPAKPGIITEPRSDIMKELTYSRQSASNCSLLSNQGVNERMLSCTRVEDEIMAPINNGNHNSQNVDSYCYGIGLGKLSDKSLMDNWLCCQDYQK